jgi:hypothetical protein
MPQVEFETTIPVFERAKTAHALDRASTEINTPLNAYVSLYFYWAFIFYIRLHGFICQATVAFNFMLTFYFPTPATNVWTHRLCYTLTRKKEMYLRSTRNPQAVLTGIVGFSVFRPTISYTVNMADMEEEACLFLKLIF